MQNTKNKGKQKGTKPMPAMGSNPGMSAMVGGMSNRMGPNQSEKKSGSKMMFKDGGKVISSREC